MYHLGLPQPKNHWRHYPYRQIPLLILSLALIYAQDTLPTYNIDSIEITEHLSPINTRKIYPLLNQKQNVRIASRIDQFLSSIESFYLQDYGGVTTLKTLRIRGFSSQYTSYSINQIPVASPTTGTINLALFPIDLFSQIEYESVPLSTLYPFLAGNLNLTLPLQPQKQLSLKLGNYGYTGWSFLNIQKHSATALSFLHSNNNFRYTLNNEKGQRKPYPGTLGSIAFHWTPIHHFSHHLSTFAFASLQNAFIPPPIVKNNTSGETEYISQNFFANGWQWKWTPSILTTLNTGFALTQEKLYYQTRFQTSQYQSRNLLLFHQLKHHWGNHETALELKWEITHVQSNQYGYQNQLQLIHRQIPAIGMTETIYLPASWTFHWKHQLELSPQYPLFYLWGGILKKEKPTYTLWISLQKGRRIPSINELYFANFGNPNITPEKALSSELALLIHEKRKRFPTQLTFYYTETQDKIVSIPIHPAKWTLITLGKTFAYGTAISSHQYWTKNFHTEWNMTYQKAIDQSIATGNLLPYFPTLNANFFIKYIHNSWISQLHYQYFGKRYADLGNHTPLQPYHLLNLRLQKNWQLKSLQIQTAIEIYNLLNQTYELIRSYPMPSLYSLFTIRILTN